jgi:hypothetical protein
MYRAVCWAVGLSLVEKRNTNPIITQTQKRRNPDLLVRNRVT